MRAFSGTRVYVDDANACCAAVDCGVPLLCLVEREPDDVVICSRCLWAALLAGRFSPIWMSPRFAALARREALFDEPVQVPAPMAEALAVAGFRN